MTPKIGDFGLSTCFKSSESVTLESISGIKATPIYSSPEELELNKCDKPSDVYSFAMIVYEMLNKKIPFDEISNKNRVFDEVVNKGNRPKITVDLPNCYHRLIERCWSQDPNDRPTFDEIVQILKNDQDFVTECIDNENYQKYINTIEKNTKIIELKIRVDDDQDSLQKINEFE